MPRSQAERAQLYRGRKKAQPFADQHFNSERMVTVAEFLEAINNIDMRWFLGELAAIDGGDFTDEFNAGVSEYINEQVQALYDKKGADNVTKEEESEVTEEAMNHYANEIIGVERMLSEMVRFDLWTLIATFKRVQNIP